jgi:hypothetical protein
MKKRNSIKVRLLFFVFLMKRDTIRAIPNFKKSIELNPQNTNAKERLKKLDK